jgi:hypothetical protein
MDDLYLYVVALGLGVAAFAIYKFFWGLRHIEPDKTQTDRYGGRW